MGQALYRKYRSKSLEEIVGQEHITTTLANAIKDGRISHAYLFTGPRGVGKTSIARILAYQVNGLDYNGETTQLDIIEIDAASNRRIDEIRELRDKVHIAPAHAKYKVYIIDEVHMLTREAFNALLKTLEEPPAHAIFILATTEAHKLPETIISRTQRYTFKPVDRDKVVEHLRSIAKQEKIDISDDALTLIAEHGEGSFRDSISLLDQAGSLGKKVSLTDVQRILGIAPGESIQLLLDALEQTPRQLLEQLQGMRQQGYQPANIAKQLGTVIRHQLVLGNLAVPESVAVNLLEQLLKVPASHDPAGILEVILLDTHLQLGSTAVSQKPSVEAVKPANQPKRTVATVAPPKSLKEHKAMTAQEPIVDVTPPELLAGTELPSDVWHETLAIIKQRHNTLYSIMRMANPVANEDGLVLKLAFPFHQKRLNESRNKQLISDVFAQVTGKTASVTIVVDKQIVGSPAPTTNPEPAAADKSNPVETISNIFGAAEVLES